MSTRIARRAAFAVAFSLSVLCSIHPANAAQRTFVATSGSDSSASCSLAAPCRGFAKAITVTDPGGELVVLDSGGYGSVTVNNNVTILSPAGVYAGISVFAGADGITVTAPATKVVLRGLTINGQTGNNGIRVQAGEVHIESTVISNMAQAGILVEGGSTVRVSGTVSRSNVDGLRVAPTTGTVSVLVRDSEFSNNATAGIGVSPSPPVSNAMVTVERTSVTKNGAGIVTAAGTGIGATVIVTQSVASENVGAGVSVSGNTANVFVRESAITRNGTGLLTAAGGQLTACGANLLVANGTAQSGIINVNAAACLDQLAGGSGTVTSVGTGPGLAGGPITTAGTINLAATNLLPTLACATNQVPQWNGSAWICASAATGSVTSLTPGSGITLAPNPITTTGSIAADTTFLQRRVTGTCAAGSSIRTINSDGTVVCEADDTGPANAFVQNGNAFGATAVLGTTDNQALEFQINGGRVMRYEPNAISPNVIGGSPANNVTAGVRGATIAGGGVPVGTDDPILSNEAPNRVTDAFGTVSGGYANVAGNDTGTNTDSALATIGGGFRNTASGFVSTIGGGDGNTASGLGNTVSGGISNNAAGNLAAIGGGSNNLALGASSFIAGGQQNVASGDHSWAGGRMAMTQSTDVPPILHHGAFVWADNRPFEFHSVAANEFAVRSTGGVRLVTSLDGSNNPAGMVAILPGAATTMLLRGSAASNNSTRLRFEESPASGTCIGGFAFHDGAANVFNLGVNNSSGGDCTPADDINSLQIHRNTGRVGVLTAFASTPANPFTVGTDTTNGNGAHVTPGGVFTNGSSRSFKTAFAKIDAQAILARVVALPIGSWSYRGHEHERHLGPVAEDFKAAFGLGGDERYIGTVDADGVALVAIQGLNAKLEARLRERDAQIDAQHREIEAQRAELAAIRDRLVQVESLGSELAAIRRALAAPASAPTNLAAAPQ